MPPPTESTILSRYLLPPSSLPTILPYTTYLSLLPSKLRSTITNDAQSSTAQLVKRLYIDLQYQRDIDIDTVRQNIHRECARSEVLKARLRREVREELDENVNSSNVQSQRQANEKARKRKRAAEDDENDDEDSEPDQLSISEGSVNEEESTTLTEATPIPTTKNKSKPTTANASTTQPQPNAPYDPLHDPLEARIDTFFSGARGLAAPTSTLPSQQRYHTTTSLLEAMHRSVQDLEKEISDLDTQAGLVLEGMKETVGGMSDLRYGKFARVSGGGAGGERLEEEGGLEGQVTEALRELKQVLKQKTRRSEEVREQA